MKNKFIAIILMGLLSISLVACGGSSSSSSSNSSNTATVESTTEEAATEETATEEAATEEASEEESAVEVEDNSEPDMTMAQKNAVRSAEQYLKMMSFSRQGLIDQLSSEYGSSYEEVDAEFAVAYLEENNLVDWKEQAVKAAEGYVDMMGFSKDGLIDQLTSEYGSQFTMEEAEYAVEQLGY